MYIDIIYLHTFVYACVLVQFILTSEVLKMVYTGKEFLLMKKNFFLTPLYFIKFGIYLLFRYLIAFIEYREHIRKENRF